CSYY
ncbi:putative RTX toxin domain protein, partial [Vibrio parahaemolyticus 50]